MFKDLIRRGVHVGSGRDAPCSLQALAACIPDVIADRAQTRPDTPPPRKVLRSPLEYSTYAASGQ